MCFQTKILLTVAAAVLLATILPSTPVLGEGLGALSAAKTGAFPKGWRTWPLQGDKAKEVYTVADEGGTKFIRAVDDHDVSQQIFWRFNWEVKEKPMLSWRWRATELPAGARENDDNLNDSACGVYVIVGQYQGNAIKYAWSSALAPGTVVTRRDGKLKIKILDSGAGRKGSWVKHQVDVLADYQALFGEVLDKNPSGIALLTDGNAVHKPAGCDYTDFAISGKAP